VTPRVEIVLPADIRRPFTLDDRPDPLRAASVTSRVRGPGYLPRFEYRRVSRRDDVASGRE